MFGATARIDASISSDSPDVRYTSSSGSSAAGIAATEFCIDPRGTGSWSTCSAHTHVGVKTADANRKQVTQSR
jgi:hypothetical protein